MFASLHALIASWAHALQFAPIVAAALMSLWAILAARRDAAGRHRRY